MSAPGRSFSGCPRIGSVAVAFLLGCTLVAGCSASDAGVAGGAAPTDCAVASADSATSDPSSISDVPSPIDECGPSVGSAGTTEAIEVDRGESPTSTVTSTTATSTTATSTTATSTMTSTTATSTTATEPPPPSSSPPIERVADRAVHISIDGLRSDHVTPELMPNLSRLVAEGASTLNARTDPDFTQTLPNHTSQLTGRPVFGASGHHVDVNVDDGTTVLDAAGGYVASVFDVVHDRGGSTVLYAGKPKFDMMDRSWNTNGAPDVTGPDDGTSKIDDFRVLAPDRAVERLRDRFEADPDLEYAFFHIRNPDSAGHEFSWASPEYRMAATAADAILGAVLDIVESDARWAASTAVIVVADHGGPTGGSNHRDEALGENYTIPFVVWGPGVAAGADLYDLNGERAEPGSEQPSLVGPQPIRGHDVANLALGLLGYPAVPGSTFNAAQDLAVG